MDQEGRDYIMSLFPAISKIRVAEIQDKIVLTRWHAWKRGNFQHIEDLHQFEPARAYLAYTNLDHTNQVCQTGERMVQIATEVSSQKVNLDYLLAGAVLHDVDKVVIFNAVTGGFTDWARQVPHAVAGGAMARAEGLPGEVAHIIGAHSIKYSPHPPEVPGGPDRPPRGPGGCQCGLYGSGSGNGQGAERGTRPDQVNPEAKIPRASQAVSKASHSSSPKGRFTPLTHWH